mgnify:CR=1 FL=1
MKDSGIEWIGDIPEGWRTINPKALFTQRKDKAQKGERQLTSSQQYGILYQDNYMELTGSKVVTVEKDFDILKHVEAGDFVISMRSFQGGLEYSTKSGAISSAYVMLVPNLELVYPRFYRWLLKSSVYIDALQRTTNMVRDGQAMRYSNFAQVRLFTLPLDEQKSRADFLDLECSSIDKILFKTRSSVEEYKKLKQAVITQAVTKGVRGKREMKDSGVEWIGEIPKEWGRTKIKMIASFFNGDRTSRYPQPSDFVDSGVAFLTSRNIDSDEVDLSETKYITDDKYKSLSGAKIQIDDIIFCLRGSVGKCAINRTLSCGTVASSLATIRPKDIYPEYLLYFLLSNIASTQTTIFMNGTCAANLSAESVGNYYITLPISAEQKEIANYLDAKCAEIDGLIAKKEQLVKELESYKKSLIYEVVTGKREV